VFKKILVANRGEIACRVIATARRMGICTVAVYSEADRDALHVDLADEAVPIGPAPAAQSYLSIDRLLEACRLSNADAVHPGYGFLSENEAFARALGGAGITFIGPPAAAIAAMGDKIASKKIAREAGVNTIPGHPEALPDAAAARAAAHRIGYPVMLKASAGGGGKGMRIARDEGEIEEGFRSAAAEALGAFGDGRLLIEKFIVDPRHIEIQILADAHGNVLHLGERECSIQRRHQKVVEEAPSPFVDERMREEMGRQAVLLAQAVGYRSAGTVEFVAGAGRDFYFLEMNTRLQVEHPVTEMITGLDLVEQMIRIAAGERLAFLQDNVQRKGWAVEARLYSEDPQRNFLPSTGRLVRYRPPRGDEIRVDTGVREGSEIGIHYDPMIAKLVAHGADRETAIERLTTALDAFVIRGVEHNGAFLAAIARHPRFRAGRLTTGFIAEEFPKGFAGAPVSDDLRRIFIGVGGAAHFAVLRREQSMEGRWRAIPSARGGVVPARGLGVERHLSLEGLGYDIALEGEPGHCCLRYEENGRPQTLEVVSDWRLGDPLFSGTVNAAAAVVQIERAGLGWRLRSAGAEVRVDVLTRRAAELLRQMPPKEAGDTTKMLLSPMPGLLVSVAVARGQQVRVGEELAVVEAMKMQNVLRAVREGTVKEVHAAPGASLAVDQPIIEFA
jgi:propionyl-CoA carboxylase alpha chain